MNNLVILSLEDHGEIWQSMEILFKSLKHLREGEKAVTDRGNDVTKTEVSGMFPNINNDHTASAQKILFNWCFHFSMEKYLPHRIGVKVKCKYT